MKKTLSHIAKLQNKDINLYNKNHRNYASIGGKSKMKKQDGIFTKDEKRNIIHNGHVQYITDFNIIYNDPKQIEVYQIGTLYTKKTSRSYEISNNKNYLGNDTKQNFEFFTKMIKITSNIHYVKNSIDFFEKAQIRNEIESKNEYKIMFNQVIKELKARNIEYKIAETHNEKDLTGLNVLRAYIKDDNLKRPIITINNETA